MLPAAGYLISIHAPSRERPAYQLRQCKSNGKFQSTLPRGSDSEPLVPYSPVTAISIHAPSRERLGVIAKMPVRTLFQSTLPRGSDTSVTSVTINQFRISIHAPSRERPVLQPVKVYTCVISIHAPSRERPPPCCCENRCCMNFNPRSLAGATQQAYA